jgi:SET domain-containing protein
VHGLGVFASLPLKAGALVDHYEGRRYSADEAERRDWNDELTYVFGLSDGSFIDGATGGNATKHLNHACEPNCQAFELDAEGGSIRLIIETVRPIARGEELTIDYALQIGDDDPGRYPCACGASTCRGTLAEVKTG